MKKDLDKDFEKGTGWFDGKGGSKKGDSVPVSADDLPRDRRRKAWPWVIGALLLAALVGFVIMWWPSLFGESSMDNANKKGSITATMRPDTTVAENQAAQICMKNWDRSGRPRPVDLEFQCTAEAATVYALPPSPNGQSIR